MSTQQFDLVAVGHIIRETIYFSDRVEGPVLGSPPAYSLVGAARQGIKTGIVTKVGPDIEEFLLKPLCEAGVDMRGLVKKGCTTTNELIYDAHGNKEIRYPLKADPITPEDVPREYHNSRIIYICPMDTDIPVKWLDEITKFGERSAVDLGGYGGVHMSVSHRNQIDVAGLATEVCSFFDFVKASDEDCLAIFGDGDLKSWAGELLECGPEVVLITLGSKGVFVCTPEHFWEVPALKGKVIDTTGGGDTFMAGFLCEYLRGADILSSAIFGCATALCVIEKTGGVRPDRMPTEKEARARVPSDIMDKIVRK